jgi:hypothetical protein
MSILSFTTKVNNSQLKQGAKEAGQSFQQMAKDAQLSGDLIDRAYNETSTNVKAIIQAQKDLIKSIETDIAGMNNLLAITGPGKAQQEILLDRKAATKALAEEQGRLQSMQAAAVVSNEKEIESHGGIIASLGKWMIGMVTVGAAIKLFKSIMESTTTTANFLEQQIGRLTGAWQVFLKAIATGDFKDLFNRMREGSIATQNYIKAMEEVTNIKRELAIEESKINIQIEQQRLIAYAPKDEASDAQRLAAMNKMLELIGQKAKMETGAATMVQNAVAEKTAGVNKLTADEVQFAIENYKKVEEIGNKYNQLQARLAVKGTKQKGDITIPVPGSESITIAAQQTDAYYKDIERQLKELDKQNGATMGHIWAGLADLAPAERELVAQAIQDTLQKQNQAAMESKRLLKLKATTENQIAADANEELKKQSEYQQELGQKRIDTELKIEGMIIAAQKDGDQKSRDQALLDYRQTLNDLDKQKTELIKKYNEDYGGYDKAGQPTTKYVGTLSTRDQQLDTQARLAAKKDYDAKVDKIDTDAGIKLKNIQDSIAMDFASAQQKEIIEINKKYDAWIKAAIEAGATEAQVVDMNESRRKELENASKDTSYKMTAFYKEAFGDLSTYSTAGIKKALTDVQAVIDSAKPQSEKGKTFMLVDIPEINAEGEVVHKNITLTVEEYQKLIEVIKKLHTEQKKGTLVEAFGAAAEFATKLATAIGDSDKNLTLLLSGLSVALKDFESLGNSGAFTKAGMSEKDAVSAIISGASDLVSMIAGQVAENKKVMKDYYDSIIAQQQEYNLALNEQLRLNEQNNGSPLFTNYVARLKDSVSAFADAQSKYHDELEKFRQAQAIVGEKSVVSGGNVLKGAGAGALAGAGIGSVVPVIGTAIGAAVGGVVGAIAGLFAKKKKDVVAPLLETYPDLIKANGEFNDTLAQTLLDNNKIAEGSKKTLQNLIEWKKAADAAKEQLHQIVADLAGQMGDDLSTALENAFENGTNAAQAFGDVVSKVLDNILSKLIFDKVFEKSLTALGTNLEADLASGDNAKLITDFQSFFSGYPALIKQYDDLMTEAQKAAGSAGLSIFHTPSSSSNSVSNQIQSNITEDTGTELAGLMRMIADDNRKNVTYNQRAADELFDIVLNSAQTVTELRAIETLLGGTPAALPLAVVNASSPENTSGEVAALLIKINNTEQGIQDYNKQAIDHMVNIEVNTFDTVVQLKLAIVELQAIKQNTRPAFSGL